MTETPAETKQLYMMNNRDQELEAHKPLPESRPNMEKTFYCSQECKSCPLLLYVFSLVVNIEDFYVLPVGQIFEGVALF